MDRTVAVRFVSQPKPVRSDESRPAPLLDSISSSEPVAEPLAADRVMGSGHQVLNRHYTFENFVVGNSNRLACVAAQTVADNPGKSFNPFFLYGGVGLGKTHLMHSVGHEVRRRGHRVLYVPAEGFTNDFVESLRNGSPEAFRDKYRTIDVLLLDDVQFIAGKSSTQEELFHTFNTLFLAGRQIVLSADSMPDNIAALEKRLSSRFKSGLCVDLQPPGFETRMAILQKKAEAKGLPTVPRPVLELIARRLPGSVRRLEGALNLVIMQSRVVGEPLTADLAEAALTGWIPQRTAASPQDILSLVAARFGVSVDDLKGPSRSARCALPRQVGTLLLHEEAGLNRSEIGRLLGGRDHSTVSYSLDRVGKLLDNDADLRRTARALREELRVPIPEVR
jgi:chromosomal replication initiator protein